MSYALGTRGYIPNLKDWDKDLYKDRGPGGEIRYKVNEKDQQYLSERQISEMKSDFLNKGQAEHTDKQYWSDIRFNESVRGTLGNIRDIPGNIVQYLKDDYDRGSKPNMDIPKWMLKDERYSKHINQKTGHFHNLRAQKDALNQYDVQRDATAAQARIDQGVIERDKLLEANRIENAATQAKIDAELNKPVSTGNIDVNSTQALQQKSESTDAPNSSEDPFSLANVNKVYGFGLSDAQVAKGENLPTQFDKQEGGEEPKPTDKTDQPDPNKAQQNFDKIAGVIHGLAAIDKALNTGEFTPPRIPSSWESVKSKTAEVSTDSDTKPKTNYTSGVSTSIPDLVAYDPDKKKHLRWRMIS